MVVLLNDLGVGDQLSPVKLKNEMVCGKRFQRNLHRIVFRSYFDESCEWYCSSFAISSVNYKYLWWSLRPHLRLRLLVQIKHEFCSCEGWKRSAHSPRSFAHCIFFCSTNDSSRFKLSLWSFMIIAAHVSQHSMNTSLKSFFQKL